MCAMHASLDVDGDGPLLSLPCFFSSDALYTLNLSIHTRRLPTPRAADMKMFDWTAKYSDDRGIIRAAMMARKKKMARYLSEEAFRRGTSDNVCVCVVWMR